MNDSNHLIIMAGGIGNRFWPVSTREKPKQFIDVLGCGKSLLQLTVEHFKGICPIENIWVVTSEEYATLVREQLPQIDEKKYTERAMSTQHGRMHSIRCVENKENRSQSQHGGNTKRPFSYRCY